MGKGKRGAQCVGKQGKNVMIFFAILFCTKFLRYTAIDSLSLSAAI